MRLLSARCHESRQVAELGVAMIETYRANGIIATAKHFPGHGNTTVDSHESLPIIARDLSQLETVELAPFRAAIDARVDAIMTAHVQVPAIEPTPRVPATLSPNVLQRLLRDKLGYQNLILTDSLGMGAIDQTYGVTEAAGRAFLAGADILAFGADPGHTPAEQRPAYHRVLSLVRSGAISQSRLDESVRRILVTKARYGLLDWKPVNVDEIPQQVGVGQHIGIAQRVAQDSITLVKNEPRLLPIKPDQSVLVIWPRGMGNFSGAIRAYHSSLQISPVGLDPTPGEIGQAAADAQRVSVVVVGTVNARLHPGQVQLVKTLESYPLIVAALDAPYDLMSFPQVSAYLASYGSVPVSLDALAQVLLGINKPRGRLPVDLPGLYALGYGMTDYAP